MVRLISALAAWALASVALSIGPSLAEAQENTVPQEIRSTVEVLFSGDASAVEALLVTTEQPCSNPDDPDYSGPQCPEGIDSGTPIEAFPAGGCEGAYVTNEQFPAVVEMLSSSGPTLVGVYEASPQEVGLMRGDYVAVYTGIDGRPVPGGVWMTADGITGSHAGCPSPGSAIGTLAGFEEHFGLEGPLTESVGPSGLPETGQGGEEPRSGPWLWLSGLLAVAGTGFLIGPRVLAVAASWGAGVRGRS